MPKKPKMPSDNSRESTLGPLARAVLLELGLVLVHLLRARCAILVAEQAEQRAAEVLRHVDRRDGRLGIELLFRRADALAALA